ncbi:hypothetical protein [Streptomyces sp. NPDC000229]|uniref:hypothetical protein n=1 Tax=Streptomyces sp. NPDC000229 TaxID=3154247 RepID=UPI003318285B
MTRETVLLIGNILGFAGTALGAVLLFFNGRRTVDRQIAANERALDRQVAANERALDKQIAASERALQRQVEAETEHLKMRTEAERHKEVLVPSIARNAAWQMHKRGVYSDLLEAAQRMSDGPTDDARRRWAKERARALIVADEGLRTYLLRSPDPEPGGLRRLVTRLHNDVHPPAKGAPEDEQAEDQEETGAQSASDGGGQAQPSASASEPDDVQ